MTRKRVVLSLLLITLAMVFIGNPLVLILGMCLKATIIASSSRLRTVERGSVGPALRSSTVARLRHFRTVFGLMP